MDIFLLGHWSDLKIFQHAMISILEDGARRQKQMMDMSVNIQKALTPKLDTHTCLQMQNYDNSYTAGKKKINSWLKDWNC